MLWMPLHRHDLLPLALCLNRSPLRIYSSRPLIGENNFDSVILQLGFLQEYGRRKDTSILCCGWPCINLPSLFLSLCLRRAWGVGQCSGSMPRSAWRGGRVAVSLPLRRRPCSAVCTSQPRQVQRGRVRWAHADWTPRDGPLHSSEFDRLLFSALPVHPPLWE